MFIDKKAEKVFDQIKDYILSYLEVDPNKPCILFTVNAADRDDINGWAQFKLSYIDLANNVEKVYIRLETNTFKDHIFIKPTKIKHIKNVDLLVFYNEFSDSVYISDKKITNHKWLEDKTIRSVDTSINNTAYYKYHLDSILSVHGAVELFKLNNKIQIIRDSFVRYWNQQVFIYNNEKPIYQYKFVKKFSYVQSDKKDRETIYYCFNNEQQADKAASIMGLVDIISNYTSLTKHNLEMKLRRAMKAETYTEIPCNGQIDKRFLNSKGNIEIGLSNTLDAFLTRKVSLSSIDKKMYKKVQNYKKKHDTPRDSWTDEEKELFWKI